MMNGVETGGKVMLIKELLKQQNVSICEISRKVNASYNYVSHIKSCLRKNLPTHLHQKKFRSRNPKKK